ncbi:hypothetical protein [Priestia filamentosa]|uniref:hypothetical protein n=1 Tax=Priestia filamentosa TaxID=1402861 RepID=UPI000A08B715|nr:hypothetical protein [Priestia filamentosa]MDT3765838.1 hypothetical protein [Priestia filamentosa]OXS65281.1 hypothetical protein B1B01_23380 [Priestia filamentosa]SMF70035.1 hypothetical protein SAMN06296056_11171 [Priestia filamentosa]
MRPELTPLFQLNLLVHLSLPYPEGTNLYPYFYKKGYTINQIEKSIPVEPRSVKRFKENFEPKKLVTPEVILYNEERKEYLLIECKVQNFHVDWSHHGTKQAAGYMSLTPNYLKEVFALENKSEIDTKVIYGVKQNDEQEMFHTLQSISKTVKEVLGHVIEHDTFGIGISHEGVHLTVRENGMLKRIKVLNEKVLFGNNPLIYMIPVDINGQLEKENKEILQVQVRNALRGIIGKNIGPQQFSFSSTLVCEKINPVWEKLPSKFKKKMKRWVHDYVREIIDQIIPMGIDISINQQNYFFESVDEKGMKTVRTFLLSERFLETGQNTFNDDEQITIDEFLDTI